jgi:hypothetical protein
VESLVPNVDVWARQPTLRRATRCSALSAAYRPISFFLASAVPHRTGMPRA